MRSPTINSIMTKINGLMIIRAHNKLDLLRSDFLINLEKGANATFCFVITKCWMMLRLEIVTILINIIVILVTVLLYQRMDSDFLTYTISVVTDLVPFISLSLAAFAEL